MDNQQDNQGGRSADAGAVETASVAAQAGDERAGAMSERLVLTGKGM